MEIVLKDKEGVSAIGFEPCKSNGFLITHYSDIINYTISGVVCVSDSDIDKLISMLEIIKKGK